MIRPTSITPRQVAKGSSSRQGRRNKIADVEGELVVGARRGRRPPRVHGGFQVKMPTPGHYLADDEIERHAAWAGREIDLEGRLALHVPRTGQQLGDEGLEFQRVDGGAI